MSYPVSEYPQVRDSTKLIRSLLPDEPVGLGFAFVPMSVAADAGGTVTMIFQTAPGYIVGDNLNLSGFAPAAWNSVSSPWTVSAAAGNQIQFVNPAVASTSPTTIGTVQGYGTGKNYTDTKLMPLVNSSYRSLQRALKMAGSTELKVSNAYVTIPGINMADPSCVVSLGFSGLTIKSDLASPPTWLDIPTPLGALPNDCLRPLKLWERTTGSSDDFQEMADLTEGVGIPSRPQGYRLSVWEWIGDSINFIGSLQDNDIAMRYQRSLPYLSDGGSNILILDSHEYISFQTAYLVESGRGGKNTQLYQAQAEESKEKLIAAETRAQQSVSRRPRGYSSRNGPRVWRW